MGRQIHVFPVNRVEGDLEMRIELTDGVVTDAWSSGTLYRGFENIMKGRSPMDSLVITPRICGICSTAHLKAAAGALDMFYRVSVPNAAMKIRNIAMGVEIIQNDVRQAVLLFMCDFANPVHNAHPLFDEAVSRYAPLKGSAALQTITETAGLIEIIAILGGQWPHSSFMIPGGVVSAPSASDLIQCINQMTRYRRWYEDRILGCRIERFSEIRDHAELQSWLSENEAHRQGEMGFFIRFAGLAGLNRIGRGHENFISYGSLPLPADTKVKGIQGGEFFLPAGFCRGSEPIPFDQARITEDVTSSWFSGTPNPAVHPFEGVTIPYATGGEGDKYSWAKAPRYMGLPAETGPLAQMMVAGHPLFADMVATQGASVYSRELARLARPAVLIPALETWLRELASERDRYYQNYKEVEEGSGYGLAEAPRGSLGHWVRIRNNRIENYQIITPTAWNGSPRDAAGVRGPWEEAVIGVEVADPENPVSVGHVIRSFDPCLVCTVHAIQP